MRKSYKWVELFSEVKIAKAKLNNKEICNIKGVKIQTGSTEGRTRAASKTKIARKER